MNNTNITKDIINPKKRVKKSLNNNSKVNSLSGKIGDSNFLWEDYLPSGTVSVPIYVQDNIIRLLDILTRYLSVKGLGYPLSIKKGYEHEGEFASGNILQIYSPYRSPNLLFKDLRELNLSVGLSFNHVEIKFSSRPIRYKKI
jgi:hypothetical protein